MIDALSAAREKASLRRTVLARRDALDPQFRIEASLAAADRLVELPYWQNATTVSGFLPIRSEIDARPAMAGLRALGLRLCVPVVMDKTTIAFRELLPEGGLVPTGYGTVGPDERAAVLDPDVMIVPLSAFDAVGNRMGYGAGYYDRAIERLEAKGAKPKCVGLAFSCQQVDRVPMEAHDRRLDCVATEQGVLFPKGEE